MNNILLLSNSEIVSGAEKILMLVGKYGSQSKFKPIFCVPRGSDFEKMLKNSDYNVVGIEYNKLSGLFRFFNHIKIIFNIFKICRTYRIKLIYGNRNITGKYGVIIKLFYDIPAVYHLHDVYKHYFSDYLMRYAESVIAVSYAVKNSYPKHLRKKIKVIYNGLENADSEVIKSDSEVYRHAEIYRMKGNILIAIAGRVAEWKGQLVFVEAAKLLLAKYSNVIFMIIGDISYDDENLSNCAYGAKIIQYIKSNGIEDGIILTGWQKNTLALIDRCSILVNASVEPEPLGTTIIEAMSLGKPIIASDIGGNPEMVVDGKNGYLFEPRNSDDLAYKIEMLINNEDTLKSFGNCSREFFTKNFHIDQFSQKIIKELENAMARN